MGGAWGGERSPSQIERVMARESGARNEKWGVGVPGTRDQGPRTKELERGHRERCTEHGAQKVSKNLVLYRLGPIGSNPIGGGQIDD